MRYIAIKEGKERRIIVDETGKKLRKAFRWKAEGTKIDEILLEYYTLVKPRIYHTNFLVKP